MNLKSIRKNYDALSLRERYLLFERALEREDESEINAIVSASPKRDYQMIDFYELSKSVNNLNLVNLLERLKCQELFDLSFESLEKSDSENSLDNILLCGYLYTIETDAWKAVSDEFGFDAQGFRQKAANDFLTFGVLEIKDEMMRRLAFTEDGVRKVLEAKKLSLSEMKTLENQTAKYRGILIEAEKKGFQ